MDSASILIETFLDAFDKNANPQRARQMEAYMRNQFSFYGIPAPLRKQIIRTHVPYYFWDFQEQFLDFIHQCWLQDHREFKYLGLDLSRRFVKKLDVHALPFFEQKIGESSWWDTVDGIAPNILGYIVKSSPETMISYCQNWIENDNFWYQRSAIILQLTYREKTNTELLAECIKRRAGSKEFFIQKAIGWALRQYAKTNPDWVRRFISKNKIAPLSIREAMKSLG